MFIKDGIAYAGDASPALKICGVRPLADWKLWVRFNTGEVKSMILSLCSIILPLSLCLMKRFLNRYILIMELLYGTMAILILRQRSFTKMVLIQEKVHRIFLVRKIKNYRSRSFAAQDGSFAL